MSRALHPAQGHHALPGWPFRISGQQGQCLGPSSVLGTKEAGAAWSCVATIDNPRRRGPCPLWDSLWHI